MALDRIIIKLQPLLEQEPQKNNEAFKEKLDEVVSNVRKYVSPLLLRNRKPVYILAQINGFNQ